MRSTVDAFRTRFVWLIGATAVFLTVPLLAMQFTKDVNWTFGDFAVAAALLIGLGTVYLLGAPYLRKGVPRLAFATILVAVFALIWMQLAVGVL